jgi:hypothetical protein
LKYCLTKAFIAFTFFLVSSTLAATVALKPICSECGSSDNVVVAEDVSLELGLRVYVCETCGKYYIRDGRYPNYTWYSKEGLPAIKSDYARIDADRRAAREEKTSQLKAAGWPDDAVDRVLRGEIRIGDPPEIVREAWGSPDETCGEDTAAGTAEIWVYSYFPTSNWVRFENGKVREYQNYNIHRD